MALGRGRENGSIRPNACSSSISRGLNNEGSGPIGTPNHPGGGHFHTGSKARRCGATVWDPTQDCAQKCDR
jgi:hypothetical protein